MLCAADVQAALPGREDVYTDAIGGWNKPESQRNRVFLWQGICGTFLLCHCRALGRRKGSGGATPEEAAALTAHGSALGLALPGLPALSAALGRHAAWEASVQRALSGAPPLVLVMAWSRLTRRASSHRGPCSVRLALG